jgi:hypothetical protein
VVESVPESKRSLAKCAEHGLHYDPTRQTGCVVCRRSERTAPTSGPPPHGTASGGGPYSQPPLPPWQQPPAPGQASPPFSQPPFSQQPPYPGQPPSGGTLAPHPAATSAAAPAEDTDLDRVWALMRLLIVAILLGIAAKIFHSRPQHAHHSLGFSYALMLPTPLAITLLLMVAPPLRSWRGFSWVMLATSLLPLLVQLVPFGSGEPNLVSHTTPSGTITMSLPDDWRAPRTHPKGFDPKVLTLLANPGETMCVVMGSIPLAWREDTTLIGYMPDLRARLAKEMNAELGPFEEATVAGTVGYRMSIRVDVEGQRMTGYLLVAKSPQHFNILVAFGDQDESEALAAGPLRWIANATLNAPAVATVAPH